MKNQSRDSLRKKKSSNNQENYNWNLGDQNRGKGLKRETEYAILVGVIHGMDTEERVKEYMDELEFLAMTAGAI